MDAKTKWKKRRCDIIAVIQILLNIRETSETPFHQSKLFRPTNKLSIVVIGQKEESYRLGRKIFWGEKDVATMFLDCVCIVNVCLFYRTFWVLPFLTNHFDLLIKVDGNKKKIKLELKLERHFLSNLNGESLKKTILVGNIKL